MFFNKAEFFASEAAARPLVACYHRDARKPSNLAIRLGYYSIRKGYCSIRKGYWAIVDLC